MEYVQLFGNNPREDDISELISFKASSSSSASTKAMRRSLKSDMVLKPPSDWKVSMILDLWEVGNAVILLTKF